MKAVVLAVAAVLMLGATPPPQARATLVNAAEAFVASATPQTARSLLRWLDRYDSLLKGMGSHWRLYRVLSIRF